MTPIEGLVVAVNDKAVTIRLKTGLEVQVTNTNRLNYGDLVYVVYDYTLGQVKKVYLQDTIPVDDIPVLDKEVIVEVGEIHDGEEAMFAALSLSYQYCDE